MPSYTYQALNSHGKKVNGQISADSTRQAREQLRRKELTVLSLTQSRKSTNTLTAGKGSILQLRLFRANISMLDLMVFTRQLATLMGSGMPLEQSLRLMTENTERRKLSMAVEQIRTMITEGYSIARALENAQYVFPLDYIATVAAGEESGRLPEVLNRLADDLEQQTKARQSLGAALAYPAMLMIVCVIIVVVLMVSVVPRVARVFIEQNQELPTLTSLMIAISNAMVSYGVYVLGALIAGLLIFTNMMRSEVFRFRVHRRLIRLPMIGHWIILNSVIRWSRSLSILLSSGVPSLQALQLALNGVHNLYLRQQLHDATNRVREGKSLSQALKNHTDVPQFLVQMVSSGESSANLDNMLLRASDYYSQALRMTIEASLKLFEPMLILVMGGLVLMIVMSVLLPIFGINQLII